MTDKRWSPNAWFYDAFVDLVALEEYIGILEVDLPRVLEGERKRIWQHVKAGDEEAEYYTDLAEYQLNEGITTRFLTGSALIATWATYESIVKRTADGIQQSKGLEPRRWTRGQGTFIEKARQYFESELRRQLHVLGTDWIRLNAIYDLRNVLAHANGQLEDWSEREQIEKLVNIYPGLKISNGCLIISIEFIRSAFEFINQLLLDLGQRTDSDYEPKSTDAIVSY